MGSFESSAILCVVIGGSELRLSANMRRLSRIRSSDDKSVSGMGFEVDSLRDVSKDSGKISKQHVRMHPGSMVEQTLANALLDIFDGIPQLLGDSLSLEGVDGI